MRRFILIFVGVITFSTQPLRAECLLEEKGGITLKPMQVYFIFPGKKSEAYQIRWDDSDFQLAKNLRACGFDWEANRISTWSRLKWVDSSIVIFGILGWSYEYYGALTGKYPDRSMEKGQIIIGACAGGFLVGEVLRYKIYLAPVISNINNGTMGKH